MLHVRATSPRHCPRSLRAPQTTTRWHAVRRRSVGGVAFECVRGGLWVTPDHRHAIVEQMHGRAEHEWLLFRTNRHELSDDPIAEPFDLEDADFWSGEQIAQRPTMGELAVDVATELLTTDQIESVLRSMIGVPRKNAHPRAIIADCRGALGGSTACRWTVAREWLKIKRVHDAPDVFDDLFSTAEPAKKGAP